MLKQKFVKKKIDRENINDKSHSTFSIHSGLLGFSRNKVEYRHLVIQLHPPYPRELPVEPEKHRPNHSAS
jgi:hypothetical protein